MRRRHFLGLAALAPVTFYLPAPNIWLQDKQYSILYKFNPFTHNDVDLLRQVGHMAGKRATLLSRDYWGQKPGFPLKYIYIPSHTEPNYDEYSYIGWKTETGLMDHCFAGSDKQSQVILNAFNEEWLNG